MLTNTQLLIPLSPTGKSTLLRQTCLLVILAQLGCKVPAAEMALTPVDRIFTRIGASDRIMAGQSTFFVELAETAMILHAATEDSLCILDELGRGTATFDGTAVAHSVVHHLVSVKRCRALFATHYHLLVADWEVDPRVKMGHMDCIVQPTNPSAGEAEGWTREDVTFLYKLCDGASPKSYGIHVAQLAGLPQAVLELAQRKSLGLEAQTAGMLQPHAQSQATSLTQEDFQRTLDAVFDALCSIFAQCGEEKLGGAEFVYLIAELWRRFTSLKTSSRYQH
jgi:DNA mismatch repair protein MSH6